MSGQEILAWSPFDPWHMLVLGIVALLLFGKRLPEVGRSLGRGIAEFKKGLRDVQEELNREDDEEPEPPKGKLRAPEDDGAAARRFTAGEDDPAPKAETKEGAAEER